MMPAAFSVVILVVVLVGAGVAIWTSISGLKKDHQELREEMSDQMALMQGEINKLKQRAGV